MLKERLKYVKTLVNVSMKKRVKVTAHQTCLVRIYTLQQTPVETPARKKRTERKTKKRKNAQTKGENAIAILS